MVWLIPSNTQGQSEPLSIDLCYTRALRNNPLAGNQKLYQQETELNKENISSTYLPGVQLGAEAKYLSEVINFSGAIPIPGLDLPTPPNDQYNLSINVNQMIYDGGLTRHKKTLEESILKIKEQSLNVELYRVKDQINQLYFGLLFQQKNDSLLKLSLQILEAQIKRGISSVQNGLILPSDLDVLTVEKIGLEEKMLTNKHNLIKGYQMLGVLIDSVISPQTHLEMPEILIDFEAPINRPELDLFKYQTNQIELNKKLISAKTTPKISGFGQFGYGQPGLNPINDTFDTWYIVGLRMTWKFWDWNQGKREKEVLNLQQDGIRNQMENFDRNVTMVLKKEAEEIMKFKKLLEKDKEIISLRKNILATSSAKMEKGVIASADYVRDFNNFLVAKVQNHIHELQLVQAKFNYLTAKGNNLGEP